MKKIFVEDIKKIEEEETNGIVPVLCDRYEVFYDVKQKMYYSVIKVNNKKIRLEEV